VYNPSGSKYLTETSESLKKYLTQKGASPNELYACSPLDLEQFKDDRSVPELLNCINSEKLKRNIEKLSVEELLNKELWIIICCGSFAPIHKTHLYMGIVASEHIDSHPDKVCLMVYYIPNNIGYTTLKIAKRGDEIPKYLTKEDIPKSLEYTFKEFDNFDMCKIDMNRERYCEWYVCTNELINIVRKSLESYSSYNFEDRLKFAFVGGEDLIKSPSGLYKGINVVDFVNEIMVVPRDVDDKKKQKYKLANDVVILKSNKSLKTYSSSKVRKFITDKNYSALEECLHTKTLEFFYGLLQTEN